MKKILLTLSLVTLVCLSCTLQNGEAELQTIRSKVVRNDNFLAYSKAQNDLALMALNRESSFKGVDMVQLQKQMKNIKTLDEAKEVYRKAGVKGGDKMATIMFQLNLSLFSLLEEVPELRKLTREQFDVVMKVKSSVTENDVRKSAEQILNQEIDN